MDEIDEVEGMADKTGKKPKVSGKKFKGISHGPLEGALGPMVAEGPDTRKPTLTIRASFDRYTIEDNGYRKKEIGRLKEEIKALKGHIKEVKDEDIVSKARKSMEQELARKQARLMEEEAYFEET